MARFAVNRSTQFNGGRESAHRKFDALTACRTNAAQFLAGTDQGDHMRTAGIAALTIAVCMLAACATSDTDAGSPSTSELRPGITSTNTGPPVSIDPAAPDGTVPQLSVTLTVDGQTFTVTERDRGHDYNWDSGPNPGYGFSEGALETAQVPADQATKRRPPQQQDTLGHYRSSIRDFLSSIDPNTGYLED